ncbi:hypothetical protein ACR3H8_20275 [Pseudomonas aeruginosa]|uniref:hypothetical protein n=1 Tax=Pseudomonas aeruginosa TaxID=287 RepID=UPI000E3267BC|nr:hypothetical protein [Pseudomonas aeruginosa]MCC0301109.1 hypothetical protein [Pseudomonas aeruginosa]MCC0408508.1 hypothetical protein [Pseudomonas aeruginosa]MCC0433650.1 hypothetical protein [Pseudomonas aeruginosa]MCR3807328.1 hypothetical protein [Pseudomonas aeruginosa]MCT5450490.1 hypothetical protein [Pseudomonas aeruginosa]
MTDCAPDAYLYERESGIGGLTLKPQIERLDLTPELQAEGWTEAMLYRVASDQVVVARADLELVLQAFGEGPDIMQSRTSHAVARLRALVRAIPPSAAEQRQQLSASDADPSSAIES